MAIPRRWKFAIAFWVPFTALVLLYQRYPWVDTLWMGLSMFAVLALSVYLVVKKFRSGGDERIHARSPLGYPHWLMHFLRDDDEKTKENPHPRNRVLQATNAGLGQIILSPD